LLDALIAHWAYHDDYAGRDAPPRPSFAARAVSTGVHQRGLL
jgi:hypothetical protein